MTSTDMSPTVRRGALLSLEQEPMVHRGDIVALNPPKSLHLQEVNYLLRRVVGLPGETISAHGGHVLIDGQALREPYLPPGTTSPDFKAIHIPASHYVVLGDSRGTAIDSRHFGPVRRTDIVGRGSAPSS